MQAKIEFENGAHFSVDTSWILPDGFCSIVNQGVRVVGSHGMWEVDSQDRGVFYVHEEDDKSQVPNPYSMLEQLDIHGRVKVGGYVVDSMIYFLEIMKEIKGGTALKELRGLYPSGEEAIVSTEMCEAIHRSAHTGKIVDL